MGILDRWLDKRGVKKVEDLDADEAITFNKYKTRYISSEPLTIEAVKNFCQANIKMIEGKCDGINPLTILQQASLHVYTKLLQTIEAPEVERENLEKEILQLME